MVHEREAESLNDSRRAADRVHGFSIAGEALVGVDAHVEALKKRRFDVSDLQLRTSVGGGGLLQGLRKSRQAEHAGHSGAGSFQK